MSKMKKCKVCGADIAKSAKVCPQCGAKNKKSALGIILVILGICIFIGALGSGTDKPKKTDETPSTTTENSSSENEKTFGVGDIVELNDVKVTLTSVSESYGSEYNKPEDGNVFLLCEFEIENNSSKEIAVSSMMSFEPYCDDYACNYSLSAIMEKGNKNQLDGNVASGKKITGVVGYEVPDDWSNFEIRFSPSFWSKDVTFVYSK